MIKGTTYAVRHRNSGGYDEHLRDSADRLVNEHGAILYRYGTYDKVLWTTYVEDIVFTEYNVPSATTTRVVPAGLFTCYEL